MNTSVEPAPSADPIYGYCHEAFFYRDLDEFMHEVVGFIRDGEVREEPVLVALGKGKLAALQSELGTELLHVTFTDMEGTGWNPARIIPAWERFLTEHQGQPVRGIGEPIVPGQDDEKRAECHRHEALLNCAFTDVDFWLLCPYDLSALEPRTVDEARRNHPFVHERGKSRGSGAYPGSRTLAEPLHEPLLPPPAWSPPLHFGAGDLAVVRQFVGSEAKKAGLGAAGAEDFVVAANEIATNSLRYGGGHGTVTVWDGGGWLYCEFSDDGLLTAPLVGRVLPSVDTSGGRGLWIANQICELVQIRCHQAGSQVRLRIPIP